MMKAATSGKTNTISNWVQAALFTRNADSYFDPILKALAPGYGLSAKYQRAQVVGIHKPHNNAAALRIRPPKNWQGFIPGQYISCEFEINGIRRKRNYSICSPLSVFEKSGEISLCAHRVEGGIVSNYLIDELRLGSLFGIGEAQGEMTLEKHNLSQLNKPILFLAAGSGITPIASIISSALENGELACRPSQLIYSCANQSEHLFRKTFDALAQVNKQFEVNYHCTRQKEDDKRIDAQTLQTLCPNINQYSIFICGSHAFTSDMQNLLLELGVNRDAIHYESFDSAINVSAQGEGKIHFQKSNKQVVVKDGSSILEQAELLGLNPKSGCRMGVCHSCTCTKSSGVVVNRLSGEQSSSDEEEIRLCISQPLGEVTINL